MLKNALLSSILFILWICFVSINRIEYKKIHDASNSGKPETPRITSVGMHQNQFTESDTTIIWYDDFHQKKEYLESKGEIDYSESFNAGNGSMKAGFKKGDVGGEGDRKVAFGDFPGGLKTVQKGRHFNEIYWRIYVKHEYGWVGAPAKMSRASSIVSENWQQAMIAHVWSGDNNSLTLDPASGVMGQSDSIVTTKYNDFANLRWLSNKPCSKFQISATEESGYWVMVEAGVKLNSPGKSNGTFRLWIDGRLESERTNLNFRGNYTKHGINAVFLESYWNSGAVKTEGRWYDNFLVSTRPIGPVSCPVNPVLYKTPYHGPGKLDGWEVELATDFSGKDVVYKSNNQGISESISIIEANGAFAGTLLGHKQLLPENTYFCRVRQKSNNKKWSDWSRWHQPFLVK